jgi:hypothetical protein
LSLHPWAENGTGKGNRKRAEQDEHTYFGNKYRVFLFTIYHFIPLNKFLKFSLAKTSS